MFDYSNVIEHELGSGFSAHKQDRISWWMFDEKDTVVSEEETIKPLVQEATPDTSNVRLSLQSVICIQFLFLF